MQSKRRGLANAEEMRLLADGLKQKLALYAEEARFHVISGVEKLGLSRKALDEEYALELAALQRREALGEQSLADRQRVDDLIIEAARRRDDETASLMRSALQEQGQRISVLRRFDRTGLQFAVARARLRHGNLARRLQEGSG